MIRTIRSRALFGVFAVAIAAVAVVSLPARAHALDTSAITRLNTSRDLKEMIEADGNLFTYEDEPGGVQGGYNVGVFDLSTDTEAIVATDSRWPDVSGNTIVYAKSDGVYAYDWPTRTESLVAEGGSEPRIDGRTVVYGGGEGGSISGVDLSTGATFTVSTDPNAYAPDVRNGWVVYCVLKPCNGPDAGGDYWQGDIMAYQISTKKTYTLCNEKHDQRNPHISSTGFVVWEDERNSKNQFAHSNTDIYGCSVYNRTNVAVVKEPGFQSYASADGNLITYCDSRKPGGYLALGIDLLSGVHFGIVPPSLTGTEMLSWSGLKDGALAWTYTKWRDDGSDSGTYTTDVYVARPTQIDVADTSDAYANAASASREAFPEGADSVVIASGESWTDDLAAASLADTDTPLLLTKRTSLPKATADEIRRLGATSATIIGAADAVSSAVQSQIQAIISQNIAAHTTGSPVVASTVAVTRIGGNRNGVADNIAARVAARPGWDGTVIVASDSGWADALAAAPLASSRGIPVVLSSSKGMKSGELHLLRSIGAKRILVLGNSKRVPSRVDGQLRSIVGAGNVIRLGGSDSYSTASAVAAYGVGTYGLSWNNVGLVSASSFSNALTGGLRKGRLGSVVLLTSGKSLSTAARSALKSHRLAIRKATCFGGTKTVTKTVRGQVRSILH